MFIFTKGRQEAGMIAHGSFLLCYTLNMNNTSTISFYVLTSAKGFELDSYPGIVKRKSG